jgi:glucosamine 6-phosphate synthetase-like amidotransferase/phosphosugar isomerase protein
MCGISGIVGQHAISGALFESIRNLEYRGYDSCGVAIVNRHGLVVRKDIGTVEEVNRRVPLTEVALQRNVDRPRSLAKSVTVG